MIEDISQAAQLLSDGGVVGMMGLVVWRLGRIEGHLNQLRPDKDK